MQYCGFCGHALYEYRVRVPYSIFYALELDTAALTNVGCYFNRIMDCDFECTHCGRLVEPADEVYTTTLGVCHSWAVPINRYIVECHGSSIAPLPDDCVHTLSSNLLSCSCGCVLSAARLEFTALRLFCVRHDGEIIAYEPSRYLGVTRVSCFWCSFELPSSLAIGIVKCLYRRLQEERRELFDWLVRSLPSDRHVLGMAYDALGDSATYRAVDNVDNALRSFARLPYRPFYYPRSSVEHILHRLAEL